MSEETTQPIGEPAGEPQEPVTTTPAQAATADVEQAEPKWLPERLERARQTAVKELLDGLGVDDPAKLKSLIEERKAAEEAQLSELQKAQKARDDLAARAEAAEAENARIKREFGFRDAWSAAGKAPENLAAALKLVDWPEGDADFADLVKKTVAAYPVLDPEPAKPDTGSAVGRRSAPPGPNPLHAKWDGMLGVPVGGKE